MFQRSPTRYVHTLSALRCPAADPSGRNNSPLDSWAPGIWPISGARRCSRLASSLDFSVVSSLNACGSDTADAGGVLVDADAEDDGWPAAGRSLTPGRNASTPLVRPTASVRPSAPTAALRIRLWRRPRA